MSGGPRRTEPREESSTATEPSLTPLLIAFLDLRGYAVQAKKVPDLESVSVLEGYFAIAAEAIERAGGRVVKLIGDAVLAVFPPEAAEAGVLELVALKPRIDRYMEERGWGCRMAVRIHFGEAVAGPFGPPGHRRFDVLGREVNAAALLASSSVTVSEAAYERLSERTRARFRRVKETGSYVPVAAGG